MDTVVCPEQLIFCNLADFRNVLLKGCRKGEYFGIDLSEMKKIDLSGFQLLISAAQSVLSPLFLYPEEQAKRIQAMCEFCGMDFSDLFRILED